ncbi:MAG: ASCH domain protein [Candidatus Lokiarchaeota archaeon]|nr:ASCH domain protein [Candidatus Lokiarchaeota archaeon]
MVKLFAIKQKYSKKIFSREKLLEYRRQNINISKNERCFIYTSAPIKKINGCFIVKEKIRLPIQELWSLTKEIGGISKKEFLKYFEGCKEGTAIIFKSIKKFIDGLPLSEIRKMIKGFRPPQSYYNLRDYKATLLLRRFGYKIPSLVDY